MFNLTLLIQSLNFLIAYWLLARFFFKPVLAKIKQEVEHEQNLQKKLKHCLLKLKAGGVSKKQIWRETELEFGKYTKFNTHCYLKPQAQSHNLLETDLQAELDGVSKDEVVKLLVHKIITTK